MTPTHRISLIEVSMLVLTIAIAAAFFAGALPEHREWGRIRSCSSNLRSVATAMYIYAQDGDIFPMATDSKRAGEMTTFSYRTRLPQSDDVPSPTADLWMMLRLNNTSRRQVICPSSSDVPDPLSDTTTVFDFAGPQHLSYAYAYQYHPSRRPLGTGSNPVKPILADANPFLKGGLTGSVMHDRQSIGRGNSRNHRARAGQNIVYVDGHAAFRRLPVINLNIGTHLPREEPDNIYTTHSDGESSDPGNAPTWTRIQIGSKSDYCLVP